MAGAPPLTGAIPFPQPGQQPSPVQIQAMQQQFQAEAARQGITPQELALKMRAQMQQQMQAQAQQQQGPQSGQQQQGQQQQNQSQQQQRPTGGPPQAIPQQVPIQPGPPKPEAIAIAKFLRSQELKTRPCVLQDKRRDMFKVKRALRALQSPAYAALQTKNPTLPSITDRASAETAFKQLPLSMLAIRVSRIDADKSHKKQTGPQGIKKAPVWNVKIEQQQDAADGCYYVWFYEGSQWRTRLYALAALAGVITMILYPLWPFWARLGVWYVSIGCLGLIGAFFGLAVVRLILFMVTVAVGPKPGLWLYPNLFADVGFFDSFRPAWDWRETRESLAEKKAEKKAKKQAKKDKKTRKAAGGGGTVEKTTAASSVPETKNQSAEGTEQTTEREASATGVQGPQGTVQKRNMSARVEDAEEE